MINKTILGLFLLIITTLMFCIICSHMEQHYPTHRTVNGHDFISVEGSFVHNPDCPKCINRQQEQQEEE